MQLRPLLIILLIAALLAAPTANAAGVFRVPAAFVALESGSFEGVPMPEGVYIPASVHSIAPDAFLPRPGVIYGQGGSYAESYARAISTRFETLSLRFQVPEIYLNIGMTIDASAFLAAFPADPSLWDLAWSSSNPSCATVSGSGAVKALAKGVTVITASSHGVQARLIVNVITGATVITSQNVSPKTAAVKRGATVSLTASCSSCSAEYRTGTWYTDDPSVISIPANWTSSTIKATAVGVGTANVYVISSSGLTAGCRITVSPAASGELILSDTALELEPGDRHALDASLTSGSAAILWSSSDPLVAAVDDTGLVSAIAGGTARITAETADGISASCAVSVAVTPMTEAQLSEQAVSGFVGDTHELHFTFSPETASPARFLWVSEDASVAAVDAASGRITFVNPGSTAVRGLAVDGSGLELVCSVSVDEIPIEEFALTDSLFTLNIGETAAIGWTVTPDNASYRKPSFSVSDPRVAMVDENGVITALAPGSAVVTATVGRGEYEMTRYVSVTVLVDNPVTYRLLVINEYSKLNCSGFLPFSDNSTRGVKDAFERSNIGGARYTTVFRANPSASSFRSALSSLADLADENDVTVVYVLTHGSYDDKGYKMGLTGSDSKIYGSALVNALREISGHVVLMLCTCHSGRILNHSTTTSLMNAGGMYTGKNGPGKLSILCSATDTTSCYYDTSDTSASYDFFSYAVTRGLGWDMIGDAPLSGLPADANGDGNVTLNELAVYSRSKTVSGIADFISTKGVSKLHGNPNQYPNWRFASGEGDLVLLSLGN